MDNVKRIIEDVKREKERTDKLLKGIVFEVRGEDITMFFEYEQIIDNVTEDQNFVRHHHDPEWVSREEMTSLQKELDELNVKNQVRKDLFI